MCLLPFFSPHIQVQEKAQFAFKNMLTRQGQIKNFTPFLQANKCFVERAPLVFSLPVTKSVFPAKLLLGHPRLISVAAPSTRASPRALDKLTSATNEESSTPWTGHRSQKLKEIKTYIRIIMGGFF